MKAIVTLALVIPAEVDTDDVNVAEVAERLAMVVSAVTDAETTVRSAELED